MTQILNFLNLSADKRKENSLSKPLIARMRTLGILKQDQGVAVIRKQRNDARKQRDEARDQRNDARKQRDVLQKLHEETRAALTKVQKRSNIKGHAKRLNYLKHIGEARAVHALQRAEDQTLAHASIRSRELEQGVVSPEFSSIFPERITPPKSVAFATVSNAQFLPGLEVLIASLRSVYPDFCSDIIIYHDDSISPFSQARVTALYENAKFIEPDMTWLTDIGRDSENRKRIGILGYLSVMALDLPEYERVVVLDSDTAIIDDISAFWTGIDQPLGTTTPITEIERDTIYACHDHGARPWAAISSGTGAPIVNSGIISIPRSCMNKADLADLKDLAVRNTDHFCPLLDRFADQKAWNRFIATRKAEILPINFNCNIKYLDQYRGGDLSFVRMVHFAGPKPWYDPAYMNAEMIPKGKGNACLPAIWHDRQVRDLGRLRQRHFTKESTSRPGYFAMSRKPRLIDDKPTAMFIGNGPSLNDTDLSKIDGFETFAFNWFVLHDAFDEVKPNHLMLASHMFYGGWLTQDPQIPENFLASLHEKQWKPILWTSFYFKEYMQMCGLADAYDVRYLMFEKPHKQFIDATGLANTDPRGFVQDGRTGVLSMGLPLACQMGYRQIALVGCDSNYNQSEAQKASGNYFYDKAKHTSLETRTDSLTSTWTEDGPGFFAYRRQQEALERLGGSFIDFTVNGALPLPKGDLATL